MPLYWHPSPAQKSFEKLLTLPLPNTSADWRPYMSWIMFSQHLKKCLETCKSAALFRFTLCRCSRMDNLLPPIYKKKNIFAGMVHPLVACWQKQNMVWHLQNPQVRMLMVILPLGRSIVWWVSISALLFSLNKQWQSRQTASKMILEHISAREASYSPTL